MTMLHGSIAKEIIVHPQQFAKCRDIERVATHFHTERRACSPPPYGSDFSGDTNLPGIAAFFCAAAQNFKFKVNDNNALNVKRPMQPMHIGFAAMPVVSAEQRRIYRASETKKLKFTGAMMAYTTTTTTPSFFARVQHAATDFATRVRQYRLYRETLDGLSELNDRELADLGLNRAELRSVAWDSSHR